MARLALAPAPDVSAVTVRPRLPSNSPVTPRVAPVPVSPEPTGLTAASVLQDTGIMALMAARVSPPPSARSNKPYLA